MKRTLVFAIICTMSLAGLPAGTAAYKKDDKVFIRIVVKEAAGDGAQGMAPFDSMSKDHIPENLAGVTLQNVQLPAEVKLSALQGFGYPPDFARQHPDPATYKTKGMRAVIGQTSGGQSVCIPVAFWGMSASDAQGYCGGGSS